MSNAIIPKPCPFCAEMPFVGPADDDTGYGSAAGWVQCLNPKCTANPYVDNGARIIGEFGRKVYQRHAIRRWNKRCSPTTSP